MKTIHLEDLLGRQVRDVAGKRAGRIEEFVARRRAGGYVIEEVLLGREALSERLGLVAYTVPLLRWLGGAHPMASHCARWEQIDWSDPKHPRLKCAADELGEIKPRK